MIAVVGPKTATPELLTRVLLGQDLSIYPQISLSGCLSLSIYPSQSVLMFYVIDSIY
jgi:hypothetical protein